MTVQEAIEKSIEGGFNYEKNQDGFIPFKIDVVQNYEKIWLDPSFWSSLGKAMGEENYEVAAYKHKEENEDIPMIPMWLGKWHNFIDSLAEGGSIVEYFDEL